MRTGPPAQGLLAGLRPETVREMELASWERLADATRCVLLAGRPGAAVYLAGYAGEMALKTACFALLGGQPTDPVPQLLWNVHRQSRVLSQQGALSSGYGHGHSLVFWLQFLRHLRHVRRLPRWTAAFDAKVVGHVAALAGDWSVEMRYRQIPASRDEALRIIGRAGWIVRNRKRLWR